MIGFVIVNYNSFQDVIKCINSIENTTKEQYKIFIIDNASTDDSFNSLKRKYRKTANIEIILAEKNGGYSSGNNIGINRALSEGITEIIISNSDIIFYQGAVENLVGALDEKVKIVGPLIQGVDGCEQQIARRKIKAVDGILGRKPFITIKAIEKRLRRFYDWNGYDSYEFSGMVSGCCFAIDGVWLKEQGLFDENIFLYFEEDVLAYYLEISNKKCKICSEAKVLHQHSKTISKEGHDFSEYYRWLSNLYVIQQYTNANRGIVYYMFLTNILFWGIKSIYHKNYRKRIFKFVMDNLKVIHMMR